MLLNATQMQRLNATLLVPLKKIHLKELNHLHSHQVNKSNPYYINTKRLLISPKHLPPSPPLQINSKGKSLGMKLYSYQISPTSHSSPSTSLGPGLLNI